MKWNRYKIQWHQAFVGAMYCELGIDAFFRHTLMLVIIRAALTGKMSPENNMWLNALRGNLERENYGRGNK